MRLLVWCFAWTCIRAFSILLFRRLQTFVFVMLITLLPLSGQELLEGKESPTFAANNSSSNSEGWKMPLFFRMKDMKKVLLWFPACICSFLPERKNLTCDHWESNLVILSSLPGKNDWQ